MAEVEQELMDEGVELVYVLESGRRLEPGTAKLCREILDELGSTAGWCVGDSQTEPEPGTFDTSPFSVGRGFDLLVPRDTMVVLWTSSHGTPEGNENLTGEDVLAAVRDQLGR